VRCGKYRSVSEFLREAIDEKLTRMRRRRLEDQVARYCAKGYANEDPDLVRIQAFESDES
jgi:Arc/MetJ-type ribon-helix-helix transcriptional regulator